MRATCSIEASTYAKARELATKAFAEFFGDEPFEITSEDGQSEDVLITGQVLTWRCTFEAVAR